MLRRCTGLNSVPPKFMFAENPWMGSHSNQAAPNSIILNQDGPQIQHYCCFDKKREIWIETWTHRDEVIRRQNRDWNDVPTCQGMSRNANNLQKLRRVKEGSSPDCSKRAWPCHHLICDFYVPELWEYKFLLFSVTKPPVSGTFLRQLWETNTKALKEINRWV